MARLLSETSGPMLRCKEAGGPAPHTGRVDARVALQIRTRPPQGPDRLDERCWKKWRKARWLAS